MEMITNNTPHVAHIKIRGDHHVTLLEGQTLKIETSPQGDDIFEGTCPAGKGWVMTVFVKIDEMNVADLPVEEE